MAKEVLNNSEAGSLIRTKINGNFTELYDTSVVTTDPRLSDARTPLAHNHDGTYATASHNHTGTYEPADADLTAIAALAPTNDDVIQRKAGAWANRTMAQIKADLVLAKGDVGLGSVDNTTDAAKPVSTAQQTALDLKANLAGPTFTGAVVLPSTTSIGTITNTELSYVDGVTSAIQTQLDGKSSTSHNHAGIYAPVLGADDNYATDAEKVKLSNLSGTNTGDQDLSGKLSTSAFSGLAKITVGTVAPSAPTTGDLWVDTN